MHLPPPSMPGSSTAGAASPSHSTSHFKTPEKPTTTHAIARHPKTNFTHTAPPPPPHAEDVQHAHTIHAGMYRA
eukprot:12922710-Prorocentrum_lima.AAC.1